MSKMITLCDVRTAWTKYKKRALSSPTLPKNISFNMTYEYLCKNIFYFLTQTLCQNI